MALGISSYFQICLHALFSWARSLSRRDGIWVSGGSLLLGGMEGLFELEPILIQLSQIKNYFFFFFKTGHMTRRKSYKTLKAMESAGSQPQLNLTVREKA